MEIVMWKDDRDDAEMATHTVIVAARDTSKIFNDAVGRFGGSTAAWACKPEHADSLFNWVSSRSDLKWTRYTTESALRRVKGLVHIYVNRGKRNAD